MMRGMGDRFTWITFEMAREIDARGLSPAEAARFLEDSNGEAVYYGLKYSPRPWSDELLERVAKLGGDPWKAQMQAGVVSALEFAEHPRAEAVALHILKLAKDKEARASTLITLRKIGTRASLPALERVVRDDPNGDLLAELAISAIRIREQVDGEE
jgi:hypothetical protein